MTKREALAILGLDIGVTDIKEIKKVYRKKAMQYHPDSLGTPDSKLFLKVNEAYNFLCNTSLECSHCNFTHSSILNIVRK